MNLNLCLKCNKIVNNIIICFYFHQNLNTNLFLNAKCEKQNRLQLHCFSHKKTLQIYPISVYKYIYQGLALFQVISSLMNNMNLIT